MNFLPILSLKPCRKPTSVRSHVWRASDTREHVPGGHDSGKENGVGCPYPAILKDWANKTEYKGYDWNERNERGNARPIDRVFVGDWYGSMTRKLLS